MKLSSGNRPPASPKGLVVALMLLLWWLPAVTDAHHVPEFKKAREYTDLISKDPENSDLYLKRASVYREYHYVDAALEDVEAAGRLGAEPIVVDLFRSQIMLDHDRAAEAVAILDGLIEQEPMLTEARLERARGLEAIGEVSAAADDLVSAVQLDERSVPHIYREVVRTLTAAGRLEEALAQAETALRMYGSEMSLQLDTASVEARLGRKAEAAARLAGYAAQSRLPERLFVPRGQLLEELGRADEARQAYQSALSHIETRHARARASEYLSSLELDARNGLKRLALRQPTSTDTSN